VQCIVVTFFDIVSRCVSSVPVASLVTRISMTGTSREAYLFRHSDSYSKGSIKTSISTEPASSLLTFSQGKQRRMRMKLASFHLVLISIS